MPSSRLTKDGRCIITSPCSWCEVGHELYLAGEGNIYGVEVADWALRLLDPPPVPIGRARGEGTDTRPPEEGLLEGLRAA